MILSNCVAQGVPSTVGGGWKFVNILAIRTREENTSQVRKENNKLKQGSILNAQVNNIET